MAHLAKDVSWLKSKDSHLLRISSGGHLANLVPRVHWLFGQREGALPLTKKPVDSGYEIAILLDFPIFPNLSKISRGLDRCLFHRGGLGLESLIQQDGRHCWCEEGENLLILISLHPWVNLLSIFEVVIMMQSRVSLFSCLWTKAQLYQYFVPVSTTSKLVISFIQIYLYTRCLLSLVKEDRFYPSLVMIWTCYCKMLKMNLEWSQQDPFI